MSEQLEIEWKTALTEAEYHQLLAQFAVSPTQFFTQTNTYFDTPNFLLQQQNCGLRIRVFDTSAELTLKSPESLGKLETTDQLTKEIAASCIEAGHIFQEGAVAKKLLVLGIDPTSVTVFAELTTKRVEIGIQEGLLAIDESWANHLHDYELELEVDAAHSDQDSFLQLLSQWNIAYKPSKNKIQRAKEAIDLTR